jgi:endo-1,4-beta-xylanase
LNNTLSAAKLEAALDSHIATVVGRYGKRAYAWDVVNEAVSDGGAGQPTIKTSFDPWLPKVPDFIDRAFTAARNASAGTPVKLFYNDYGAEAEGAKADRMYALVKGMIERKVPIDGVGFQTHLKNSFKAKIPSMERNLRRFAALGLEVHITELDVRACDADSECNAAALATQAEVYAELLAMCLRIEQCKVFEMWGFTDRHTWLRSFQNPTHKNEMPLPFDVDYIEKPCYSAMMDVLQNKTAPPTPAPAPPTPAPAGRYRTQTATCKNAVAISDKNLVASVLACEALCDANSACVAVDTNGSDCYLKSKCDGTAGSCSGWCSYVKV